MADLLTTLTSLGTNATANATTNQATFERLQRLVSDITKQIEICLEALRKCKEDRASLTEQLSRLRDDIKPREKDMAEARANLDRLQQELQKKNAEIQQLKKNVDDLMTAAETNGQTSEEKLRQLNELNSQITSAQRESDSLMQIEITKSNKALQEAQATLQQYRDQIKALTDEAKRKDAETDGANIELENQLKALQSLTAQCNEDGVAGASRSRFQYAQRNRNAAGGKDRGEEDSDNDGGPEYGFSVYATPVNPKGTNPMGTSKSSTNTHPLVTSFKPSIPARQPLFSNRAAPRQSLFGNPAAPRTLTPEQAAVEANHPALDPSARKFPTPTQNSGKPGATIGATMLRYMGPTASSSPEKEKEEALLEEQKQRNAELMKKNRKGGSRRRRVTQKRRQTHRKKRRTMHRGGYVNKPKSATRKRHKRPRTSKSHSRRISRRGSSTSSSV